ncbi:MAG: DUF5615 family PIN-like protein [Armatimonadota bacterium]
MIRFLANENFPLPSVRKLMSAGFQVDSVALSAPGAQDEVVLRSAAEQARVILTFDRDYGELVFRFRQLGVPGVIYFRLQPKHAEEPADILLELLGRPDFEALHRFTIVERQQVRQRRLPSDVDPDSDSDQNA